MFGRKQSNPRRRPAKSADTPEAQPRRSNVFSYRASRSAASSNTGRGKTGRASDEKSRPAPARRVGVKSRMARFVKVVLVLVVLGLVGYNLFLKGDQPEVIVLKAGTYRDEAAYERAAAEAFASSVFNSNKVTVNVGKIEERLKADFPELADVSVRLPIVGHRPTIYLEPSTSRLVIRTAQNEVFIVDENGRAVTSGEDVKRFAGAGLPEIQDQSRHEARLGEVAIPGSTVSYITEVVRQLKAKNVTVESITLPDSPSELHLRIAGEGYYVKFNTRGDARVAVGSFLALKLHLSAQNKKPGEYIDVRIENRAFYK